MVFAPGADVSWIQDTKLVSLEVHDSFAKHFGLKVGACLPPSYNPPALAVWVCSGRRAWAACWLGVRQRCPAAAGRCRTNHHSCCYW
jgi:hypothetical protein